jgi:hypothetical protein
MHGLQVFQNDNYYAIAYIQLFVEPEWVVSGRKPFIVYAATKGPVRNGYLPFKYELVD